MSEIRSLSVSELEALLLMMGMRRNVLEWYHSWYKNPNTWRRYLISSIERRIKEAEYGNHLKT